MVFKLYGIYHDGFIAWDSSYIYLTILYNISVCWSMYCLVMFYMSASVDLKPYRYAATNHQSLSKVCMRQINYIPDILARIDLGLVCVCRTDQAEYFSLISGTEYSSNNISSTLQDAMLCYEMPLFAWMHFYAFPWTDYADKRLSSRLTLTYAIRDALGFKDVIYDAFATFVFTPSFYLKADGPVDIWEDDQIDEERPLFRPQVSYSGNDDSEPLEFADPSPEDDETYLVAKRLVYGDFNFPVIHEDPRFYYPPNIQHDIDAQSDGFAAHFQSGSSMPQRKAFDTREDITARLLEWQNNSRSD